eukprot:6176852-Pleurochrysis_carterae.AAC.3
MYLELCVTSETALSPCLVRSQDSKLAIDHLVSMVQSLFGSSFRVGAAADLPQCLSQVERLLLE